MKNILQDIKTNEYKQVYLLYGTERYLRHSYRDKLLAALVPNENDMNYTRYEGKDIDENQVIETAETMPFLSERRVILISDSGFFKNKAERLPDYIPELPDYLTLIFDENEVDKRSRMYKAAMKIGRVTEFATQDDRSLMQFVGMMLKKENKKITGADAEFLLAHTGSDMTNIYNETQKLISYTMGRDVVTRADIDAISSGQTQNKIFEMVGAVTEGRQKRAMDLYYDLLSLKEPPMRILFLLAKQFNQLLQVKELATEGRDRQEIASILGVQTFVVRNCQRLAQSYTAMELETIVSDFVATEQDVKTGHLAENVSVEMLIVKHSRHA